MVLYPCGCPVILVRVRVEVRVRVRVRVGVGVGVGVKVRVKATSGWWALPRLARSGSAAASWDLARLEIAAAAPSPSRCRSHR